MPVDPGRGADALLQPAALVALLTVVGMAMRFGTLNVQSVWLDESATIALVHRGFTGMLSHLSASESSPPLYYILVWAWTKVFGAGVLGFRSLSALIGTVTIPVMYRLGREISPRVGVWAAALTTVNPAMFYYSQEARCYGLLILFCAAGLLFWLRALREPSTRALSLWSAMSVLGLLTHYFAIFLIVPEAVVLVPRLGLRRLRLPIGAIVITGVALLPLAYSEHTAGKSDWIENTSLLSRVAEAPKQFLVGLNGPLEIVTALVAGLLALCAVGLALSRAGDRERKLLRGVMVVAVGSLALPVLLSVTHLIDVFDGRNVIATWSACAVLVAAGIAVSRAGAMLGVGLCVVSLLVIAGTESIPGYQRDDWRGIAQTVNRDAGPGVVVTPEQGLLPLSVYIPALGASSGGSVSSRELDFVALRTERTGRSPLAPVVPTTPPPGYRLVELKRTEAYAVARFLAAHTVTTSLRTLRQMMKEASAEVLIRR